MEPLKLLLVTALLIDTVCGDLTGLHFYLYTKANKANPVELKSSDNFTNSSFFVSNQPVKFLCHGFSSNYQAEFPQDMKNTYISLPSPSNTNIIAVDWADLSSLAGTYDVAANNTRAVGAEIAALITALISQGKSTLANFHFIGHSLGGQVGAFISQNLPNGQKMPRVTGLDPARPGFNSSTTPTSQRLDASDGDFVDVIRTSPGVGAPLSTSIPDPPVGSVDFYPNGGIKQPGCILDITYLCAHSRAYKYYAESITTSVGFKSYKCLSYDDYKGSCSKTNPALMGEYVDKSITGSYYLDTKMFSPFAKG